MAQFFLNTDTHEGFVEFKQELIKLKGTGSYVVTLDRVGEGRNNEQNALYWVGYVKPFHEWLVDKGNDHITPYMSHKILAAMFLQELVADPITGEMMPSVRSTTTLKKDQFSEYLEKIGAFFVNECGIASFGSNRSDF